MKKHLVTLAVLASLAGCGETSVTVQKTEPKTATSADDKTSQQKQAIDKVVDAYTYTFLNQQPSLATSLKLPTSIVNDYQTRWPDYSAKGMSKLQSSMADSIKSLSAFDLDSLSDSDRLHLEVNQVIAHYYQGEPSFEGGYIDTWGGHLPYVVNQISGPLIDIPSVLELQHVIENKTDAENYVTRLTAFATLINDVESKVLADAAKGVVLPKVLFPNTLSYLNNFVAPIPAEHGLVKNLVKKLDKITEISDEDKQALVTKATSIIKNDVYSAFAKVTATMQGLEQKAPEQDGIWAQPNGESFYQHEVAYLGDSDLTADEIHQVGLDEVDRINKEMDAILISQDMTEGTVSERLAIMNAMPQFVYEDSDKGRQQLLDDLTADIKKVMVKAPEMFATMPTQEVIVKRVPVASQDGAAGGSYSGPPIDGSRPGVFSINLKDMKAQPSYSLKTLTYHETVPGHHFQISLNVAQQGIGIMRQNAPFNGYVEGWALYSELVAYEMGMYEGDPWGDLGRLQAEIYRAARLVVDTGLHHKRWTKQQAVDFFYNATGTAMSDVESAIDRYIAWPGQALGYKLGMLKIVSLREWAKEQLKGKFDIKAFHDLVLLPGARPLTLLERDVQQWVAKQK
jgi:uncharacterized protein (DUF885 family)